MNKQNNILIIRIDDRLIHGQVIVGWAKTLNLNNIIVANDELFNDKLKKQMVQLAVPSNIQVEFLSLKETAVAYQSNKWSKLNSILLIESPEDAYKLLAAGCDIKEVNVGGLHVKDNRKQVTQNLALNDEDKYYLRKMCKMNVHLEGRALPSDEEYDVIKVLDK